MSIIATFSRVSSAVGAARAVAGLCLAAATPLLSGCGGGASTPPEAVVTVTTTPTVTARVAPPTTTIDTTGPDTVKSDVMGRNFDLGTIVQVEHERGVPVIILDRWTARGVSDATLATDGVPIQVHSDARYENLNNKITFRIPVAQRAVFTYMHCVGIGKPVMKRPSTLDEFARLGDPERVVLLSLDPTGRVVRAENDPAC
jgi:hypothetical protein